MVRISISFNKDKITAAKVVVQGIPGQSCLLVTPDIRRMNPDARITPTEELEEDIEGRVSILEGNG
jgi:hypothetical protein